MIRYATEEDVIKIKQLHRDHLNDDLFVRYYDKHLFNYRNTLVNEENDEILWYRRKPSRQKIKEEPRCIA